MKELRKKKCMSSGMASPGPHPGARPGVGTRPGDQVFAHGTRPGTARTSNASLPSSRLTNCRRVQKGPVLCDLGGGHGRGPPTSQSQDGDSGHGEMECHLAVGERA